MSKYITAAVISLALSGCAELRKEFADLYSLENKTWTQHDQCKYKRTHYNQVSDYCSKILYGADN